MSSAWCYIQFWFFITELKFEPEPWGSGQGLGFAGPNLEVQVQVLSRMAWTWTRPDCRQSTMCFVPLLPFLLLSLSPPHLLLCFHGLTVKGISSQEFCMAISKPKASILFLLSLGALLMFLQVPLYHTDKHVSPLYMLEKWVWWAIIDRQAKKNVYICFWQRSDLFWKCDVTLHNLHQQILWTSGVFSGCAGLHRSA